MPAFRVVVTETVVYTLEKVKAADADAAKALAIALVQPDSALDPDAYVHSVGPRTFTATTEPA